MLSNETMTRIHLNFIARMAVVNFVMLHRKNAPDLLQAIVRATKKHCKESSGRTDDRDLLTRMLGLTTQMDEADALIEELASQVEDVIEQMAPHLGD